MSDGGGGSWLALSPDPRPRQPDRTQEARATVDAAADPTRDLVTAAATVGVIAAGVALFEAALIPGIVIGGAAVLAPRYLPGRLPRLGWSPRAWFNSGVRRRTETEPDVKAKPTALSRFGIGQAVAKTITFRIVVTTLDFTWNYAVIGEVATAAGLSAFALVAGPLFYLAHEAAWNSLGTSVRHEPGRWGPSIDLPISLPAWLGGSAASEGRTGLTINRALAKTITFRTLATAMDFSVTYLVMGDFATAVTLTAFGFVAGPFVYLGHEMVWDYYGSSGARGHVPPALVPAAA